MHDKQMQPVATLLIPNRIFLLWSKKRNLPYCEGCNSVFNTLVLANLCLENGAAFAEVESVEEWLTKRVCKVVSQHKLKRGRSRTKLEKDTSHFMVFEGKIIQTTVTAVCRQRIPQHYLNRLCPQQQVQPCKIKFKNCIKNNKKQATTTCLWCNVEDIFRHNFCTRRAHTIEALTSTHSTPSQEEERKGLINPSLLNRKFDSR